MFNLFGKSQQSKINELTTESIRMQQLQINQLAEQLKSQIAINKHLLSAISSLTNTVENATKRY